MCKGGSSLTRGRELSIKLSWQVGEGEPSADSGGWDSLGEL